MTDREQLLDLQSRWAAVGQWTYLHEAEEFDGREFSAYLAFDGDGWVVGRNDWELSDRDIAPEALRVFCDWLEHRTEATT